MNRLNSEEQSLHNSLLSLYLQRDEAQGSSSLLAYVRARRAAADRVHFDRLMLARLCTGREALSLRRACVCLYQMLGW